MRGDNRSRVSPKTNGNKLELLSPDFEVSKISLADVTQAEHVDRLLECIRDNDGPGAEEFLKGLSTSERRELLCKPILSQDYDQSPSTDNFYRRMDYTWLSIITAGAGSDQVFYTIVRYGAPLDVSEPDGSNIAHAVAHGSYFSPEYEEQFVKIYFHFTAQIGNKDIFRQLMLTEDKNGARPIELAAVLGKFDIFSAMMETENLYKTIDSRHGTWNRVTYDFSEYEHPEPQGRRNKSPLLIFTFLQEKDLDSPGFRRVFQSPAMQLWIAQHVNTTRIMLILWFLMRTMFTTGYLVMLSKVQGIRKADNITCEEPWRILLPEEPDSALADPMMLFVTICIASFFTFDALDGLHYVFKRRARNSFFLRPGNNSSHIVSSANHRSLQAAFVVCILFTMFVRRFESNYIIFSYVSSLLIVAMTYMFFLQFIPGVGHLTIGLQRSLMTFGSFSALFMLIFLSFALGFYVLNHVCCLDRGLPTMIYETFQIFLNQINMTQQLANCGQLPKDAWYTFHIIFVMFTVILLLNFCIAILSESAIRITNHKDILQDLQYLTVSITIEDRIGFIARPLRRRFSRGIAFGIIKVSAKLRHTFAMK